jgi:hypothetical protein
VDGEWKYAPDQPAMYDEMGNVNNVLEVQVRPLQGFQSFILQAVSPSGFQRL